MPGQPTVPAREGPAPEEGVRAGFVVHGRVQGVGFRWWTRRTAEDLGLSGSVRNRRDGTVEVRARGPASSVERLADALARGPRSAAVRGVDRFDPGDVAGSGFEIEH
ncbi:MAG: acylphosphatase [Gemmatimonadota bacterium]